MCVGLKVHFSSRCAACVCAAASPLQRGMPSLVLGSMVAAATVLSAMHVPLLASQRGPDGNARFSTAAIVCIQVGVRWNASVALSIGNNLLAICPRN